VTSEPTSPARRTYDASGRRESARRNRLAVLEAGRELLLRDGYQATTIRAVADRAGVSPDTVYKTFGDKRRLMKAVYDVALAGDDEPVPIGQRPAVRAAFAAPDPAEKIELYARFVTELMERIGGLLTVLTGADPELAAVREETEGERRVGVGAFVAHLMEHDLLTSPLPAEQVIDACWALTSPHLCAQLRYTREWSGEQYRQWLAAMLGATLRPSSCGL
jgi:AcrR family transcriptional regulator